ncbi:MAG TPA: hypothetical protein VHC90_20315 [Bryobacteraceae bacterium]|nr:hypothetical protein [Bryobacteraceae bacterium]
MFEILPGLYRGQEPSGLGADDKAALAKEDDAHIAFARDIVENLRSRILDEQPEDL